METKVVKVNGVEFGVKITGKGQPVLVVGDVFMYPRLFSECVNHQYQWIFADTRLFIPTPEGFDMKASIFDLVSDDLEAIRKKLGLGRVTVVGQSALGFNALEYARRYPNNVAGVAMFSTPPSFGPAWASAIELARAAADPERLAIIARRWEEFGGQEKLAAMNPGDAMSAEIINDSPFYCYDINLDPSPLLAGVRANGDMFTLVYEQADLNREPSVDSPVLVGMGRHDLIVPYTMWNETERAKIPSLTFHLFEKSGHLMMYEEPEEFERVFNQWMNSKSSGCESQPAPETIKGGINIGIIS
jgi:proline iminopeptidase